MVFHKGCLQKMTSEGHASFIEEGLCDKTWFTCMRFFLGGRRHLMREICAAVSTLEYQFVHALKRLTKVRFEAKTLKGHMYVTIRRCSGPDMSTLCSLGQALYVGLEMIQNRYPKIIQINLKGDVYGE